VYPFKLASVDASPEKHKSLSMAVMAAVGRRRTNVDEIDEQKRVLKAIDRDIKKQQRLVANLEKDIQTAADYEKYKRMGELLQLNRSTLKKGMKSIELEDVIATRPETITVALDPSQSVQENIDAYFRRHRKGREGLEILRRRLEIARGDLVHREKMKTELEIDFDSAYKKFRNELISLIPGNTRAGEPSARLPYRPAKLSTGVTVFIGRDGIDNDRTTFDFARPYELWFHAQQCPGSHVVMKFPNKSFEPSRMEIERTAAIAAYHSKARHDSLVPVIYTQRKHVRKPRKAKPGLVVVEREKSVMVAPQKEDSPDN
jgi:predicted ribosome quality control (RQC) complex YloA/Tae2 family protein